MTFKVSFNFKIYFQSDFTQALLFHFLGDIGDPRGYDITKRYNYV